MTASPNAPSDAAARRTVLAPRSRDRRVQRTRRALSMALVSLLPERDWDDIDVQDICARADVGRSTFYTHFQNKEELLVDGLDGLRDAMRAHFGGVGRRALPRFWYVQGLIKHAADQRQAFRAIIGRRSGHVVQQRFREMTRQLVAEDFAPGALSGWRHDAAVHHVSGALVDLLGWWVDTPHTVSVAELERYFTRLVGPVLDELSASSDATVR